MFRDGIPVELLVLLVHDVPKCRTHGHPLNLLKSGKERECVSLCVCKDCDCEVDTAEYVGSQGFLVRAVTRLQRENEGLKDELESLREG